MNVKVECERNVIQTLRGKGLEGGCEWDRFQRGERMSDNDNLESLKVNDELITEKKKMRVS